MLGGELLSNEGKQIGSRHMPEAPTVQDAQITACLETEYGLSVTEIGFLPIGADANTAVYRIVADDEQQYFLKLRRGKLPAATVTIPSGLPKRVCHR